MPQMVSDLRILDIVTADTAQSGASGHDLMDDVVSITSFDLQLQLPIISGRRSLRFYEVGSSSFLPQGIFWDGRNSRGFIRFRNFHILEEYRGTKVLKKDPLTFVV